MSNEVNFELTTETKVNAWGVTLFRIKAKLNITKRGVKKGELGGWVESIETPNGDARVSGDARVYGDAQVFGNARVYGDAQVSGNARVSGDAWVSLKKAYTRGNFLSTSDSTIIPVIIDQSKEDGFDGSDDYKYLLVTGEYKIEDIEPEVSKQTIKIGGKSYEVSDELTKALKDLKEVN